MKSKKWGVIDPCELVQSDTDSLSSKIYINHKQTTKAGSVTSPSVQNIRNNFPNIELHPILPSKQPQFVGAWTIQWVESVPQGCWSMLNTTVPTVLLNWLDVLWVVDHSWYTQETVERVKPSSVAVLDTLNPVSLAPTTIPSSIKYLVLPIHPLNSTHTQYMSHILIASRLEKPSLTCLLHFI
jgi:hypothetical protein